MGNKKKEANLFDSIKTKSNNVVKYFDRNIIKDFTNAYYNRHAKDLYYNSAYYSVKHNRMLFNINHRPLKK